MSLFAYFIKKEYLHITRDRHTLLIMFGVPVIVMIFVGFSFSSDIINSPVAIVNAGNDSYANKLTREIDASPHFNVVASVASVAQAVEMMKKDQASSAIIFSPSFSSHIYDGQGRMTVLLDGTHANTCMRRQGILMNIIYSHFNMESNDFVTTNILYNRSLSASYFSIPGLLGMVLLLICAMMTSVSIAREKENGTMDQILTSSIKPITIITAKVTPYFVISEIVFFVTLFETKYLLDVPINGSVPWLMLIGTLYILLSTMLGFLFSIISSNQVASILWTALVLLIPTMLLSGMTFPIESMPVFCKYLSYSQPSTWFISACRKLMVMGGDGNIVYKEFIVLCGMCMCIIVACLKLFKSRMK